MIDKGEVVEEGPHAKLMMAKGVYYSLVMKQLKKQIGDDDDDDKESIEEEEDKEEEDEVDSDVEEVIVMNNKNGKSWLTLIFKPVPISNFSPTGTIINIDKNDDGKGGKTNVSLMKSISMVGQDDELVDPDTEEKLEKVPTLQILKMNKPEWVYILFGSIAAAIMGAVMPVFALLFGEILGVLSQDPDEARENSVYYAICFLVVGIVSGLTMFMMALMFSISGEKLTIRVRKETFSAILRQEIGWFDEKANNTGALCARLSLDASKIQGVRSKPFSYDREQ